MKRVSIDVGGTFTDCVVIDESGVLQEFKSSTTPADPSVGFLNVLNKAASHYGQALQEFLQTIDMLVHGTTLATNTLVTSSGARVGMITTENFRDVIEIRRGIRPSGASLYNVFVPPYEPLIPRYLRLGVPERTLYTGEILKPLDTDAVMRAARSLRDLGVESVAICFLHSYANPENEQRAAEICAEVFGPNRVTTSCAILPVWREFERFSTTVVSAYLGPVVASYLRTLQTRLAESGFSGRLLMMLASGMVQPIEQCVDRAVHLLGSGPAAAPYGALHLASEAIGNDIISIDTGGTSLDVCVIRRGDISMTTESWIDNHRVAIKMVDVVSIGSGGGSIAWIDSLGLLRVGPQSAGASPGPACYGNGSLQPTLTDAAVVLGYMAPDGFLGGEIKLSMDLARQAVDSVAQPLGMTIEEGAQAIYRTTTVTMADKILEVCTRRGHDVRDFALVAGGGAGPINAAYLAEHLDIATVFIPSVSAAYSAFGMLSMDLGRDFTRSLPARADRLDPETLAGLYNDLEVEARDSFASEDTQRERIVLARSAEMRYTGQFHEVEVTIGSGTITAQHIEEAIQALHRKHEELYGFSMPWMAAEFLTFHVKAIVQHQPVRLREIPSGGSDPGAALSTRRSCFWNGREEDTPVYDGRRIRAGNRITGPAIIEEPMTTIVVPHGFDCTVDRLKNYILSSMSARAARRAVADEATEGQLA